MNKWVVITGTAKEVENVLNNYEREDSGVVIMMGMSTTNEQTTVIIQRLNT